MSSSGSPVHSGPSCATAVAAANASAYATACAALIAAACRTISQRLLHPLRSWLLALPETQHRPGVQHDPSSLVLPHPVLRALLFEFRGERLASEPATQRRPVPHRSH